MEFGVGEKLVIHCYSSRIFWRENGMRSSFPTLCEVEGNQNFWQGNCIEQHSGWHYYHQKRYFDWEIIWFVRQKYFCWWKDFVSSIGWETKLFWQHNDWGSGTKFISRDGLYVHKFFMQKCSVSKCTFSTSIIVVRWFLQETDNLTDGLTVLGLFIYINWPNNVQFNFYLWQFCKL